MLWKKQPVGSKIADLQTNKASKDAATQSAAGLMSAADKTKLDGLGVKTYGMSIDTMTTIPNNTDLNTYTTPGSYYCPNAAVAATLSNSPVTNGGFSLHVESVGGVSGQNIIQTVKQFGTTVMNEFTRTYSPTTWSSWNSLNSKKIDNLGSTFGTLESLETALTNFISRMGNNSVRDIRFQNTTTFGVLGSSIYTGKIEKVDSSRSYLTLISGANGLTTVSATCINGTWSWYSYAIKSDVAYDWNSITNYVSSLETGANAAIYRFGKVRTISFQGIARTHTEDEILATLPENDRPPVAVLTSGNIGSNSIVIRVAKDGKITLYSLNGITANARIYFGITYIVQ